MPEDTKSKVDPKEQFVTVSVGGVFAYDGKAEERSFTSEEFADTRSLFLAAKQYLTDAETAFYATNEARYDELVKKEREEQVKNKIKDEARARDDAFKAREAARKEAADKAAEDAKAAKAAETPAPEKKK